MSKSSPILSHRPEPFPERGEDLQISTLNRQGQMLWRLGIRRLQTRMARQQNIIALFSREIISIRKLDPGELPEAARNLHQRILCRRADDDSIAVALALVAHSMELAGAGSVNDTEVAAAWVMLGEAIAETPPASNSIRAITLVACTAALAGQPVHVIGPGEDWVNTAEAAMEPACSSLGLKIGILHKNAPPTHRQALRTANILLASARELAFEYLRDRLRIDGDHGSLRLRLRSLAHHSPLRKLTLKGLAFGIVAEADAILLDGANTPIAIAGLHQAAMQQQKNEIEEQLPPGTQGETLARLTLQRIFRRYLHLCGISATASEAAYEFANLYSLPVVPIMPAKPTPPSRMLVMPTASDKWVAVGKRIVTYMGEGRPILVGVGSSADADALQASLKEQGIAWHCIEQSSELSKVTACTVLIALPTTWRRNGETAPEGFRVILTDGQAGGRLDRQLAGWATDENSCFEAILSLEDPVVIPLMKGLPHTLHKVWLSWTTADGWLRRWFYQRAQHRAGRQQFLLRKKLLQYDMQMGNMLAFAGKEA